MDERILFNACPLCNEKDIPLLLKADCTQHPLYQKSMSPVIAWKKCTGCGHVFTEGYFTDEAAALIFGKTNEHQKVGQDIERQRFVSSHIVEKVLPWASSGCWLDIGFGNGSLLFTAREYGFTPVGVDLRQENVKALASLGIEAYCEDYATLRLKEKCSVISMADVLEHMPFPARGLSDARNLLADGGIAFISMPNMDNMVWKALDLNKANPFWGEIEHYHNFSRDRLYALLRETGFEPLRYGISERYRACMEVIARKA